jgi:hypothetical protein
MLWCRNSAIGARTQRDWESSSVTAGRGTTNRGGSFGPCDGSDLGAAALQGAIKRVDRGTVDYYVANGFGLVGTAAVTRLGN